MAESITGKCEFEADTDKVYLQTNLNGDTITIAGVHLTADTAASLSWLLNQEPDITLKIEIKEKE